MIDVTSLSDDDLANLIALSIEEQQQRALARNDVDALTEDGFERGFTSKGEALEPWLSGGLLVCPGMRIDKSATSHECRFINVEDAWVWESEHKVTDEIRNIPGPRTQMRSITILSAPEGLEFDLIASRTRGGIHERKNSISYKIVKGALEVVSTRAAKTSNHR